MSQESIQQKIIVAEQELSKKDSLLGQLIARQSPVDWPQRKGYFYSLCRSIIGQQVSVAAARSIFNRLERATQMKPEVIAQLNEEALRSYGISHQKATYIQDLSRHFVQNPDVFNHLDTLSDEGVIKELRDVNGIGRWTAEMFLIFTLQRFDVFAVDDAGLHRAMQKLYGWEKIPRRQELEQFALKWHPHRSVACLHLWQSLNNVPG